MRFEVVSGSPTPDEHAALSAALENAFAEPTMRLGRSRWKLAARDYDPELPKRRARTTVKRRRRLPKR